MLSYKVLHLIIYMHTHNVIYACFRHEYNSFNSRSYVAEIVIFSVLKRFVLSAH